MRPESRTREPRSGVKLWLLFFGIALLLVLLMQWFVVARVVPQVESGARAAIDDSLQGARGVWLRRADERAQDQAGRVALIVKDQGFLATINPEVLPRGGVFGDEWRPTVTEAMDSFGGRAAYAIAVMTDQHGTPLFRQPAALPLDEAELAAIVPRLRALGAAPRRGKDVRAGTALAVLGGQAYRLVMVDLGTQDAQRWLLAGYRLADELAALRDDLQVEATLLAPRAAGAQVLGTTLANAADVDAITGAARDAAQAASAQHVWRLHTHRLEAIGAQALELRLSRSLDTAVAAGEQMRKDLWAAGGLAIAAFALLLWGLSRHLVTASLDELVQQARRVGAQDYDAEIRARGPVREVRQLAGALDQMRSDLRAEQYFDRRLTQLPNRLQLRAVLARALASGEPVAVLLLGLNRFKNVNRVLGYDAGDRLLQALARRLQQGVRPGDFVARLGGDTFALMLRGAAAADAMGAAQRVGQALDEPLDLDDKLVDLHAAIGIACAPAQAADAERLLAQAEVAMYTAKQRRELALHYEPAFDTGSAATLSLLSELRHACANGELRLHLQPKILLADGTISGAEALLRWQHPSRGMVPPGQFIPYAEDTPLIRELTLWVFEAVVREQAALAQLGVAQISVNLSARDLMDGELPDKLHALLVRHGGRAEGLCLETTESAVMSDVGRAQQTLARLAERGYKLSIDDFGADQSSMRRLKDLRVHELKIDMDFIKGMQKDPRDASLVRAMIDMGHALGLSVVAEGVENEALAAQLAVMGCDEGQGWHFGKAMPAQALHDWAREWEARRCAVPAVATAGPVARPALH